MDHVRDYMEFPYIKYSLANILLFYYRTEVLRWHVPQTILFYHRDEVQVPQVPLMYTILVGYGSKSSTTLDRDLLREIPHARRACARRAADPVWLAPRCSGAMKSHWDIALGNRACLQWVHWTHCPLSSLDIQWAHWISNELTRINLLTRRNIYILNLLPLAREQHDEHV
jgi:hypothetical protein